MLNLLKGTDPPLLTCHGLKICEKYVLMENSDEIFFSNSFSKNKILYKNLFNIEKKNE